MLNYKIYITVIIMIPRFARPTKSTSLYAYTNRDQDLIKQGFRAGNFTFLAKFPSKIKPFGITAALKARSKKVIVERPRTLSVRKVSTNYEWIPDSYNLKQDYLKKASAESISKRKAISKKDFICSGTPNKVREREQSQRSYISINSSFSSAIDHASRLKWIKDAQIKHGEFRMGRSLDNNREKSNGQEMITAIKRKIANDWESTDFDIGINNLDCIEIRFFLNSLENIESMHYYMNILINKNQDIGKFGLRKVQEKWGVKQGEYLIFILAPAWIRIPTKIAYQGIIIKKTLSQVPNIHKRKSLWSNQGTHISTRESSRSINH